MKFSWIRFIFAIILLVVTGASASASGGGKTVTTEETERHQLVVGLAPLVDVTTINARYGTFTIEQMPGTAEYLLGLPEAVDEDTVLNAMLLDKEILIAGRNFHFQAPEVRQMSQAFLEQLSQAFLEGASPTNFFAQPAMQNLHLTEAQRIARGAGVKVAIIDTGIDLSHPLFAGRLTNPQFDWVDNDNVPQDELGGPGSGHGTFVAGLIALGAPDAQIMPLRVFGPDGRATSFNLARAIRFAADNGAGVINMSFGLLQTDDLLRDALDYAYTRSVMVSAAGNDNMPTLEYPAANQSKTIAVGSTNGADVRAPFSNYNKDMRAIAPGILLYSAYPGGGWAWWSGTSFSAALVSAEAAQLLSANSRIRKSDVSTIIATTGIKIDNLNPGFSGTLGRRIDYLLAVQAALTKK